VIADLHLYYNAFGPSVRRIQLVLDEKGLDAQRIEGAARYAALNEMPTQHQDKQAVLRHGAQWISGVSIIAEYLDDNWRVPSLMPSEPLRRAQARMWIEFADSRLYPVAAHLLRATDPRVQAAARARLEADLRMLEERGLSDVHVDGAYWFADQFSLVDVSYCAWFEQIVVMEQFCGFRRPHGCRRLRRWWETVAAHPTVRANAEPPQRHLERHETAVKARAALQRPGAAA
jgi:glutathione S-transferase